MFRLHSLGAIVVPAVLLLPAVCSGQPTVGQTDTFSTGTTLNWDQGAGAPAANLTVIPTGGPTGTNDAYLQVSGSGGFGAGSRLTAYNQVQWAGNYTAAPVNTIEMDLRAPNGATQPLSIRIAFRQSAAGGSGFSSSTPVVLSDGNWRHVTFLLAAENFTPVGATGSFDTFMTGVPEFRILHATGASLTGDPIAASLGVDNIRAGFTPIPEPGTVLGVAVVAVGLVRLVRNRFARPDC
jgi:hypothetical protein